MVSQQLETKTTTVLVEVHQSEDEDAVNTRNQVNGILLLEANLNKFSRVI